MIQAVRERRLANGDNVQMSGGRKAIKFGVTPTWRNSIPYYVRPSPASHATLTRRTSRERPASGVVAYSERKALRTAGAMRDDAWRVLRTSAPTHRSG